MKRLYSISKNAINPLLTLLLTIFLIAFSSCKKSPLDPDIYIGDGVEIQVAFPTNMISKAPTTGGTDVGTASENRIDRITILVFNQDGSKLENLISEDVTSSNTSLATTQPKWASDQTIILKTIASPYGVKKIYAIANWKKTSFDKSSYTETKLKDELISITSFNDINGAKAFPIIMNGSIEVPNLMPQEFKVTINMERMISKFRANMVIGTDIQNKLSYIDWQTDLMKMSILRVPNKAYVIGQNALPSGVTLLDSEQIAVDDVKPAAGDQTVPASKALNWSKGVYVNENPVVGASAYDRDRSTMILLQLPYKNRSTGILVEDNYYQIYIKDTRSADSPHKVIRNNIYNLLININGLGTTLPGGVPDINIDDKLVVNSWEKGEIIDFEDIKSENYFNVSRSRVRYQYNTVGVESVGIVTDYADWKLTDAGGVTLLSFTDNKKTHSKDGFTYNLTGVATEATISISNPSLSPNFASQEMFFVANNLKVPFGIEYDNGWIPNAQLQAQGWPFDQLPASGGLQVAMRGRKQAPVIGIPGTDADLKWKENQSSTLGVESANDLVSALFGTGTGNTDAMIAAGASDHQAAQYCRDMGSEWYIPSIKELDVIYKCKGILGPSYSFPGYSYWSSTEKVENGWYVKFDVSGFVGFNGKGNPNFVRCVNGAGVAPFVSLDKTSEVGIAAAGATYKVKVTSNVAWKASSANGLTFAPALGSAGVTEVTITVPKNTSSPRDVVATFSVGVASATWTGSQLEVAPVITLDKTSQADIPLAGGTYTVKVTSNAAWAVSSTISGVSFNPSSGIAGTDISVVITVPKNPSITVARDIPVVFKATNATGSAIATWAGKQSAVPAGSYIPRANLVASGWSSFPGAVGLQVAMRGNGQDPVSGTPGSDPQFQYKTSPTTTSGVESVTTDANAVFGVGKRNTDAMIAAGGHPAAEYCRSMGAEWYLPSVKELKAIYDNRSVLGPNYTFPTLPYWSSTEFNASATSSWSVNFFNGLTYNNSKPDALIVRCVREI